MFYPIIFLKKTLISNDAVVCTFFSAVLIRLYKLNFSNQYMLIYEGLLELNTVRRRQLAVCIKISAVSKGIRPRGVAR